MSRPTNKSLTIAGLIALGFEETFRSREFRTFLDSNTRITWMVGTGGALRKTQDTISLSRSETGSTRHKSFMAAGRAALSHVKAGATFTVDDAERAVQKFYQNPA